MCHLNLSVRNPLRWRLAIAVAAAAAACLAPSPLQAADRYWGLGFLSYDGSFGDTDHWSFIDGGPGGASVPGTNDVARFNRDTRYTVTFSSSYSNLGVVVSAGEVAFDLNGHAYNHGAIRVYSTDPGAPTVLTVTDGVLSVNSNGESVSVGGTNPFDGNATLIVTTGGQLGNAALLARPDILVGDYRQGTLSVNDNGSVSGNFVTVGDDNAATGHVTVTGLNAVMSDRRLIVGQSGAGTVTVSNGGALTSSGDATLGVNLGSDGNTTVTGAGSSWAISGTTTLGNNGDGGLAISSGGLVSSLGPVTLGATDFGSGTATVSGANSRWELSAAQTIGASGLGVMSVSSGGQVVSSANAVLGLNATGEGRVTVTGSGSQWMLGTPSTLSASIKVGDDGRGDLTVSAGGEVSAAFVTLGNQAGSIGVATVTGTGSKLTTHLNLNIGNLGGGTLDVANGAEVYVGENLIVSDPASAPAGMLRLDRGAIFVDNAFTNNGVFNFTDGMLQVAGNFQPNASAGVLTIDGADHGDLPTLDLIGAGTTANVTSLTVGQNRRGQLLLRQGRVLNLGTNSLSIGSAVGGVGTVSVQSGAQLVTAQNLSVGGTATAAGGTGTLEISGGTVDADALRIYRDGTVNLRGGTLAINTLPVLDGEFNWTEGTLRFDAAFTLTSSNVPKLLGPIATLRAGQTLSSAALATVTLQTPVVVDGGVLNASNLMNQSRIEVRSGSVGPVHNAGLLLGDGTITGAVTNSVTGKIRVDTGKTLVFTGEFSPNAGELNLQGGTLDFSGPVTNNAGAFIAGRGALYTGGLANSGQMAFSGGMADIHGDVTLRTGSRVVTGGSGSTTTFFDDVVHNGLEIFTGANASTVFFGSQSGAGSFTGTGTVYYIGDLRPGNSPALVSHGGSVVLGGTTVLKMELAGGTPGSQYDRLTISGSAALAGTLDIDLIDGFTVAANDSFTLLNYGTRSGTFAAVEYPPLPPGLTWELDYGATALVLSVSSTLLPGDIDLDGDVDRADAASFASYFGTAINSTWTTGEFDVVPPLVESGGGSVG
jgi:T5SS/PEP-CTERM-associated repeat protein